MRCDDKRWSVERRSGPSYRYLLSAQVPRCLGSGYPMSIRQISTTSSILLMPAVTATILGYVGSTYLGT